MNDLEKLQLFFVDRADVLGCDRSPADANTWTTDTFFVFSGFGLGTVPMGNATRQMARPKDLIDQ